MTVRDIDPSRIPGTVAAPEQSISPELASALQAHFAGPGGLRDAAKGRGTYMYYRKPNGEIGLSPAFITDMVRYMMEGWIPLAKYGRIKLCQYYHENQYEVLFQRGGVAEMTKEQATELRFHLRPTRIPTCGLVVGQIESTAFQESRGREEIVIGRTHGHDAVCFEDSPILEFPQFSDGNPQSYECEFCGDIHTSRKGRDSHIRVMHRDQLAAHATAQALASAIASATKD